jgi:hypothetical protein
MTTNTYKPKRKIPERTRYPYEPFMERLIQERNNTDREYRDPNVIGDKTAAEMCQVSERQIQMARRNGMDPYLLDHMCIKGLGIHPMEFLGEDWLTDDSLRAGDLFEGKVEHVG